MSHRQRMHGTDPEIDWNRLPVSKTEHIPQVFDVSSPKVTSQCPCPFLGCLGSLRTWNSLRNHFNHQHWVERLRIFAEHLSPFTKYERCGNQVPPCRLKKQHYESKIRAQGELRIRRKMLQHCLEAIWLAISVNAEPLDLVTEFPYRGHTVAYNNSKWESLHQNLEKARRRWFLVGKVVTKTGARVRTQGIL